MSQPLYTNAQQTRLTRVLPELIQNRELLLDLVWKELRVRYRYAAMGFLWAVIEPLAMTLVLSVVFGFLFTQRVEGLGGGYPYPLLLLCGLLPWQFLFNSLKAATKSLVDGKHLVTKVYLPRELLPISCIGVCLVNLAIGFVILMALCPVFGFVPGTGLVYLPAIFAIQLILTVGAALLFACANVFYRDVGYMVDVALLLGFYATPVFYELEWLGNRTAQAVLLLNPMAGIITAYRQAFLENRMPDPLLLIWPLAAGVLLLVLGAGVFRWKAGLLSDHL